MIELPSQADRLRELVQQLQENSGHLPAEETAELEDILLADEKARQWFVLSQELHTMLEVDKSIRLQLASDLLPDNVVAMPGIDPEPVFEQSAPNLRPEIEATAEKDRKNLKIGLRMATSFAAMIAAVFVMLWMYSKVAQINALAASGGSNGSENGALLASQEEKISFHKQVLPILTDNCLGCHGEDEEKRKADLRLDLPHGGINREEPVIIPGNSKKSELIARVSSTDPEYFMPPETSGKPRLSESEIAILTKWIDEGASYETGWSSHHDPSFHEMARLLATLFP